MLVVLWLHHFDAYSQISGTRDVCKFSQQTYSISASSIIGWYISGIAVPGVASNPKTISWNTTGNYVLECRYINTYFQSDTDTIHITVYPNPAPNVVQIENNGCLTALPSGREFGFTPPSGNCYNVCEGQLYNYIAIGFLGSSFSWNAYGNGSIFDDGNNKDSVQIRWEVPGQFNLKIVETTINGCKDTSYICIKVIPKPLACFQTIPLAVSDTVKVCLNAPVNFNDSCSFASSTSSISFRQWSLGDGSEYAGVGFLTHSYSSPGTYLVRYIIETNCRCRDTFTTVVLVHPSQGADIQCISTVCPDSVSVYYTNDTCDNPVWSVQNGTITGYSAQEDSITVQWGNGNSGFGVITLESGCEGGCPYPTQVAVPIVPTVAQISGKALVCQNEEVLYSVPFVPSTVYKWTVPAGVTAFSDTSQHKISIRWGNTGTYKLEVQFNNTFLDCAGSGIIEVTVAESTMGMGNAIYCLNDTVVSYPSSTLDNVWGIYTLPDTIEVDTVHAEYLNYGGLGAGKYLITMMPETGNYCNVPSMQEITVLPAVPLPVLPVDGEAYVCAGRIYTYTTSSTDDFYYLQWEAYHGNPAGGTGNTFDVIWSPPAPKDTLKVRQVMVDEPGCVSAWHKVVISPEELVLGIAGDTRPCANTVKPYTASIADGDWYEWKIIPSHLGSVVVNEHAHNPDIQWNHITSDSAAAAIRVIIHRCGIVDSVDRGVWVKKVPVVSFTVLPQPFCTEKTITCSTAAAGSAYDWDFGDGTTGSGGTTDKTYSNPGTYTIALTVTNPSGCIGSAVAYQTVNVFPAPAARLSSPDPLNRCGQGSWSNQLVVTLQNLNGSVFTYEFFSGSGNAGGDSDTTVSEFGTYYAVVTNDFGCSATTNTVTIYDCAGGGGCTPNGGIGFSYTRNCNTVTVTPSVTGSATYSNTNFDEPGSAGNTTSANPAVHTYSRAGYYHVVVTGSAPDVNPPYSACPVTATDVITVPIVPGFMPMYVCSTGNSIATKLVDTSTYLGALTYRWWIIDGVTSSGHADTLVSLLAAGSRVVTLVLTNGTDTCSVTDTITVPEATVASFIADTAVCEGTPVLFTNTSTGDVVGSVWDFGTFPASYSLLYSPAKTYTALSDFENNEVYLTVTDRYGCSSEFNRNVKVYKDKFKDRLVEINPYSITKCIGSLDTLRATTILHLSGNFSYHWNNGTTSSDTFLTPLTTGAYMVTVQDDKGCSKPSNIATVFYRSPPAAVIRGDTSVCLGTEIKLNSFQGHQYQYGWQHKLNGASAFANWSSGSPYIFSINPASLYYHNSQVKSFIIDPVSGCADTSAPVHIIVLNNPAAPAVSAAPNPACVDESPVTLVASGTPGGVYRWSNGTVNDSIIVTVAGTYTVTVADTNGCRASSSIAVHPGPDFAQLIFGCYTYCLGTVKLLQGPIAEAGTVYQWLKDGLPFNGQVPSAKDINVSQTGMYRLVMTTPAGCRDTSAPIDITFIPCPCDSLFIVDHEDCTGCIANDSVRYYVIELKVLVHEAAGGEIAVMSENLTITSDMYWNSNNPAQQPVAVVSGAWNSIHIEAIDFAPFETHPCILIQSEDGCFWYCFEPACGEDDDCNQN